MGLIAGRMLAVYAVLVVAITMIVDPAPLLSDSAVGLVAAMGWSPGAATRDTVVAALEVFANVVLFVPVGLLIELARLRHDVGSEPAAAEIVFEVRRRHERRWVRGCSRASEKLLYPGEQIQCATCLVVKSGVHGPSFPCDESERTVGKLAVCALIFGAYGHRNRTTCHVGSRHRCDTDHVAGLGCVHDLGR